MSGKESVLDVNSSTESTEGYCSHVVVTAVSPDGLATQIEATIMPRLAVLCNSVTPGC